MTGDPEVPVVVRFARNLLICEAMIFALGAVLGLLENVLVASNVTVDSGGRNLAVETLLWVGLAVVVSVLAVKVGKLVAWARLAAIGFQGLIAVLVVARARSGGSGADVVLGLIFTLGTAGLLLMPQVGAAFSGSRCAADVQAAPEPPTTGTAPVSTTASATEAIDSADATHESAHSAAATAASNRVPADGADADAAGSPATQPADSAATLEAGVDPEVPLDDVKTPPSHGAATSD